MNETEKLTFYATDMACEHCAARIKKAVTEVEGVEGADITLTEKKVIITAKGSVNESDIVKAVSAAGYTLTR